VKRRIPALIGGTKDRPTHRSTFSRQACAEPVTILPDGSIPQVECTSIGLNTKPLSAAGSYPAAACCVLTNGNMPHITNTRLEEDIPYITHEDDSQYITGIRQGVTIGYKYFDLTAPVRLQLSLRGNGGGSFRIYAVNRGVPIAAEAQVPGLACACAEIAVPQSESFTETTVQLPACGAAALYLVFEGEGRAELSELRFS